MCPEFLVCTKYIILWHIIKENIFFMLTILHTTEENLENFSIPFPHEPYIQAIHREKKSPVCTHQLEKEVTHKNGRSNCRASPNIGSTTWNLLTRMYIGSVM